MAAPAAAQRVDLVGALAHPQLGDRLAGQRQLGTRARSPARSARARRACGSRRRAPGRPPAAARPAPVRVLAVGPGADRDAQVAPPGCRPSPVAPASAPAARDGSRRPRAPPGRSAARGSRAGAEEVAQVGPGVISTGRRRGPATPPARRIGRRGDGGNGRVGWPAGMWRSMSREPVSSRRPGPPVGDPTSRRCTPCRPSHTGSDRRTPHSSCGGGAGGATPWSGCDAGPERHRRAAALAHAGASAPASAVRPRRHLLPRLLRRSDVDPHRTAAGERGARVWTSWRG